MKNLSILLISIVLAVLLKDCSPDTGQQIDEQFWIRNNGADMPVYVHGNSESNIFVIILHGAGSFGLAFRDGAIREELESKYVMIYFDQRGQSMAQGNFDRPENLIETMADDVEQLTRIVKMKFGADIHLFLMGHSWGGLLGGTVLLTGTNQDEYEGWISVDAASDIPLASHARKGFMMQVADEHIANNIETSAWQELKDKLEPLDSASAEDYNMILAQVVTTNHLLVSSGTVPSSMSAEKVYRAVMDNNPINWLLSNYFNQPIKTAVELDYSLTNLYGNLHIPSLFITGKYDASVPPVVTDTIYKRAGSADKTMLVFEHSMHHPFDTESERFASEVTAFIDRVTGN